MVQVTSLNFTLLSAACSCFCLSQGVQETDLQDTLCTLARGVCKTSPILFWWPAAFLKMWASPLQPCVCICLWEAKGAGGGELCLAQKNSRVHAAERASAYAAFTNACRSIFSLLFKQRQRHTVSFLGQPLFLFFSLFCLIWSDSPAPALHRLRSKASGRMNR